MLLPQGENADLTNDQIKSLLCTPIRDGKKDKVIGETSVVDHLQLCAVLLSCLPSGL